MAQESVLQLPGFRNYLLARTFIGLGINVLGTTVGWQIFEITQSPLALGLIGLAEFLPFIAITLVGGFVADRYNRHRIYRFNVGLYLLSAGGLAYLTLAQAPWLVATAAAPVYALIAITGLIRGFLSPAQNAFAAELVAPRQFAEAASWSTVSWQIAAVGGPALAGLWCAFFQQAGPSYLFTVTMVALGWGLLWRIAHQPSVPAAKMQQEGLIASVRQGLDFVFSQKVVLSSMALDMFAVLFGGAMALLPAFAKTVLGVGPAGFGVLRSAPALGALVMGLILAYRPPLRHAGRWLLVAVAGFGICIILFALSKVFWWSCFLLAGAGFFDNISMVIRSTIIQQFTPNHLRGRVAAVGSLFVGSSNELGAFESGVAARWLGLVPSVVMGGMITLVVVAITRWRAPELYGLDLRQPPPSVPLHDGP